MFKNNNFAKVVEDLGSLHLMVKKQPLANRLPTACHGAYSQLLAKLSIANRLPIAGQLLAKVHLQAVSHGN